MYFNIWEFDEILKTLALVRYLQVLALGRIPKNFWLLALNHCAIKVRPCYTSTYKRVEQGFFRAYAAVWRIYSLFLERGMGILFWFFWSKLLDPYDFRLPKSTTMGYGSFHSCFLVVFCHITTTISKHNGNVFRSAIFWIFEWCEML